MHASPLLSSDAATLHDGSIVAGRYRLERLLGVGGMGVVYLAEHLLLGERVALKFIQTRFLRTPEVTARFLREAKSQFRIASEHVVRVLDIGECELGGPFIAMEFIDGGTLRERMDRAPLDVPTACEIIRQTCEGLAIAHGLGITHRDIKPSNIVVTTTPSDGVHVKLIDFGIAHLDEEAPQATRITATMTVIGTPAYMAPEQLRAARAADERSDLWSVGVTLYELLAGRVPYDSESPADLILLQVGGPPPLASDLRKDVPVELARLVNECFAFDPDARRLTVASLAEALAPFARSSTRASVPAEGEAPPFSPAIALRRRRVKDTEGRTAFSMLEAVRAGRTMLLDTVRPARAPIRSTPTALPADRSLARTCLIAGAFVAVALAAAMAVSSWTTTRAADVRATHADDSVSRPAQILPPTLRLSSATAMAEIAKAVSTGDVVDAGAASAPPPTVPTGGGAKPATTVRSVPTPSGPVNPYDIRR